MAKAALRKGAMRVAMQTLRHACRAQNPDEPRVVGAGRDRRSRRRSGRERSAPAPTSRGRSGPARPSQEQGRAGLCFALPGATLFPVPASSRVPARIACHDIMPPLQPTLPIGFDSWAQVFTDWWVSQVFDASRPPHCLAQHPELAAPFVAEIGMAIRDKQLRRRPLEALIRRESAVEPAHEQTGGPTFVAICHAMESALENHFRQRRGSGSDRQPAFLAGEVERLQSDFFAARSRHAPFVEQARHTAAQDYWTQTCPRGLDDDFFDDLAADSAIARMSRVEPAWWWRSFFTKLQTECAEYHSADGLFVDALPMLRAGARKKKLAATIAEWCEARADEWGWNAPRHYRMLANRAEPKAKTVVEWFNRQAPGYLTEAKIRSAAHARLAELLARLDPVGKLLVVARSQESEHWRN